MKTSYCHIHGIGNFQPQSPSHSHSHILPSGWDGGGRGSLGESFPSHRPKFLFLSLSISLLLTLDSRGQRQRDRSVEAPPRQTGPVYRTQTATRWASGSRVLGSPFRGPSLTCPATRSKSAPHCYPSQKGGHLQYREERWKKEQQTREKNPVKRGNKNTHTHIQIHVISIRKHTVRWGHISRSTM